MASAVTPPRQWCKWIQLILSLATSAILLNGVPGATFFCRRGGETGRPTLPLLFVLAADLLQSAINKAFRENILSAPIPQNFGMDYPVIQYADDTILVMPACPQQLAIMKDILDTYAASTGLQINYHKSSMIPMNTSDSLAHSLALIL